MKVLLLAGTTQARSLAKMLSEVEDLEALASLAGATRDPNALVVPMRSGGFGGSDGFRGFLDDFKPDVVVDATHPFAAYISQRTYDICLSRSIPYLQILRSGWTAGPKDHWHMIGHESDCEKLIPIGATVFLATGRQTLMQFSGLTDRKIICRQIDPPDTEFPFEGGSFLVGRPPFSVEDERALFQRLNVDWLVVKNAGGKASRTKLDAARELGIQVAMIKRPKPPAGDKVDSAEAAFEWIMTHK
ncbi:cobalt-precorrin-6A reductase [Cochlodiniinecator piscidefendens]|uniref:cobalt-precorrin-6A reductase n=1 Tax=Cochlodiniinecator piscidefendens TaxID=2715756 RepID=UPI00140B9FEC|nr:cobalt-precorrin-6A reductase [Cochlodiniinecator piscidefendens]